MKWLLHCYLGFFITFVECLSFSAPPLNGWSLRAFQLHHHSLLQGAAAGESSHFPASERNNTLRAVDSKGSLKSLKPSLKARCTAAWSGAIRKIKEKPIEALSIPLTAAFVGWFTNKLAVDMIFYPIKWTGIPIFVVEGQPFGLLGWQGIVPAKAAVMASRMVDMVTLQLVDVDSVFKRLNPRRVAQLLGPEITKITASIAEDLFPSGGKSMFAAAGLGLNPEVMETVQSLRHSMIVALTKDMQKNIQLYLDLQELVVSEMVKDKRLIIELFQTCGRAEFRFLVNSGLWFGFLLGVGQMFLWLFFDKAWMLPVGGAVVGYLTNWLALKLIFEPVNPVNLGPFVLQGLFLKRQAEVAGEFAEFFSKNILTSEKVWNVILMGKRSSVFYSLLNGHVTSFLRQASTAVGAPLDDTLIEGLVAKVAVKMPNHVHPLHEYSDSALALHETMMAEMVKMTPAQFENVLHPIFQEDELTLIVAGGVLGLLAGFMQMVLSTRSAKNKVAQPTLEEGTSLAKEGADRLYDRKCGAEQDQDTDVSAAKIARVDRTARIASSLSDRLGFSYLFVKGRAEFLLNGWFKKR